MVQTHKAKKAPLKATSIQSSFMWKLKKLFSMKEISWRLTRRSRLVAVKHTIFKISGNLSTNLAVGRQNQTKRVSRPLHRTVSV